MPRRLSNPEYITFLNTVNLDALGLPPWGGVIEWGEQFILVYVCQASGSLCQQGEAMLTDVSDRADLIRNIPRTYDANQGVWYYQLPQEAIQQLATVAGATIRGTGKIIQAIAREAGEAAGALTQPLIGNLTPVLVALGLLLAMMYLPSRD